MNVKELNEKYQEIVSIQIKYNRKLVSYINEAFAMHGNEFVLKPEGFETWEEAGQSEEFSAINDLPTYLMKCDAYGDSHEIYPTRVYRKSEQGLIYLDGYDYSDGCFVTDWYTDDFDDDLASIACFINAVLEQENKE